MRLIRITLEDSQAIVIKNNMTGSFNVNVLVRQGDTLSVIVFNLVPDYIIKKSDIKGHIYIYIYVHTKTAQTND
jgi:hypothetical protein